MATKEIKFLVNGIVRETRECIVHKGATSYCGRWHDVKDGAIELTESDLKDEQRRISNQQAIETYKRTGDMGIFGPQCYEPYTIPSMRPSRAKVHFMAAMTLLTGLTGEDFGA